MGIPLNVYGDEMFPGLHGLGAHRVDVEVVDGQKLFAARAKWWSMKNQL